MITRDSHEPCAPTTGRTYAVQVVVGKSIISTVSNTMFLGLPRSLLF